MDKSFSDHGDRGRSTEGRVPQTCRLIRRCHSEGRCEVKVSQQRKACSLDEVRLVTLLVGKQL